MLSCAMGRCFEFENGADEILIGIPQILVARFSATTDRGLCVRGWGIGLEDGCRSF
jgi:hypothetical protein